METCRLLQILKQPPEALTEGDLADLAATLGRDVASWLLRDEVLDRLAKEEPCFDSIARPFQPARLPDLPGSCCVLYVVDRDYPLLRPAVALPLQWQQNVHDPYLPRRLLKLADLVLKHLGLEGAWSLHRLPPFTALDLSVFDQLLQHESGWAPLAGSLLVCKEGGKSQHDIWATGQWDGNGGIVAVDGIDAKLALARTWKLSRVFVPESQARERQGDELLGILKSGLRAPADALGDYLAELDAPPSASESFEHRKAWYLRQPGDRDKTRDFYWDCLLDDLVMRLREKLEKKSPGWKVSHFVTIVSKSPELAVLDSIATSAGDVLLLHTEDLGDNAVKCCNRLRSRGLKPTCGAFSIANMAQEMNQHMAAFVSTVEGSQVAIDLTPGSKKMSYTLGRLARPGNWLFNITTRYLADRRAEPDTEIPDIWQATPSDCAT